MLSPRQQQQHLSILHVHFTITTQQPITPVMRINFLVPPEREMPEIAIFVKQRHGVYVVVMHC
jgi:hypothetical protein